MNTENDKIVKLLESKAKETKKLLDKIDKSIDEINKNYLHSFKYPDHLIQQLNRIDELVNLSGKPAEEIVSEIKKILC